MSRAVSAAVGPLPLAPRSARDTATSSGSPSSRHQTVECSPALAPEAASRRRASVSSRRANGTLGGASLARRGEALLARAGRHHREDLPDGLPLGEAEHALGRCAPTVVAVLRTKLAH